MRPLHIIMPMAGEGSRFLKEGWKIPKPLIKLHNIMLFQRAIGSVYIPGVHMKYSFIVRKEHIDKYNIDKKIKEILPEANIFFVEKTTRGAVETCSLARSVISNQDAVLIMDCDLEFKSEAFINTISDILLKNIDEVNGGILVSFKSTDPKYSYAEVDENYNVIRTAEKEVISNHALCGSYFFSKAEGFLYASDKLLNENNFHKKEYYVSLLYNYLLDKKEKVKLVGMEEYYSYGTPDELRKYL